MKNIIIFLSLILSVMFVSNTALAQFGPQLTYHGRILDTSVVPPVAVNGNVQFLIQVVHPTDPTCVLYQEVQTQNLTAADGNFVLTINGGVPIATDFADLFATDSSATLTCVNNGMTYPGLPDMRKLNVYFVPPGFTNYEPLPTQTISYVPMAIEALNARTVGGFDASSLLRVASVSGSPIPVPALTQGLYDELYDTITGASSYYVLPTGTVANFSGNLSGEVTGTQSATVVSRILGQNVTMAGSTFVSGAVLTYDGTNWRSIPGTGGTVQSVTSSNAYLTIGGTPNINPILTVNVGTASGTVAAGNDSRIVNAFQTTTAFVGDVTGTVSATVVSTVGGRTAAQVATSVADTLAATAAPTANTIAKRDATGGASFSAVTVTNTLSANAVTANSLTGRTLNMFDTSSPARFATITTPSVLATSYTLTLPQTAPVSGFVLGTNSSGILSWVSPLAGAVTSVSGAAPLSSSGGSTPVISISQANLTTNGYLSAADFVTFNNKVTSVSSTSPITVTGTTSSPVIGLAASGVTSGTYTKVTVDTFGRVTSATTLVSSDIPNLDASKITTGTLPVARGGTGAGSFTSNGFVYVASGAASLSSTACINGQVPYYNGSAWTCITAQSANASNTLVMRDSNGDFTANNITTIQDLTVQRNLRVQDGTVGGFVQISVPIALGTSYTFELPRLSGAYGFPGQALSIDTVVGNTFTTKWIDTLPAALVSGSIFVGNASGTAQPRAMSGDATLNNLGVLTLSNIGAGVVSGSQYTKVTVDGKGRVTSGALINFSDVSTALGYSPVASVSTTAPITLTGSASAPVIGLATSGVTSGTYPKVTVDTFGRVTSGSVLSFADVTTGLGYTPFNQATALTGDVTGLVSATVVSFVGGKTSAQVSQSVSDTLAATSLNVSNTIVKRDNNGDFTANNITTIQDLTVQRNLRVQDGAVGGFVQLSVPIALGTSYTLELPRLSGAYGFAGQALTIDTVVGNTFTTKWVDTLTNVLASGTIFVGNASGTAQARTMSGDATINNTGVLSLSSVGAGVVSGSQYTKVTVDGKGRVTSGALINFSDVSTALGYSPVASVSTTAPITLTGTASAPVIGLATSGVTSGTYPKVTVDVFGRVTSGSALNFADVTTGLGYTPFNQATALTGDVTGTVSTTVVSFVGGKTSAQVSQSVSDTLAATDQNTFSTIVKRDASGNFIASQGTFVAGVRVRDGATGGIATIRAPVSFTSYVLTLPSDDGNSGQVLSTNGTGTLSWVSALTDTLASGSIFVGNASGTAQARTMTGDASISNTGVLTLSSIGAGVTSGTQYTKVTVDGKGRVTSGALINFSDVSTALGYSPVASVSTTAPITLTGSASAPVIGLATSGVTSGTYPKVTVDTFGRVTSGSVLSFADVTTGLGYTPFNQATALTGDVTGLVSATVVSFVGGKTSAQVSQSVSDTLAATSLNVSNTIVKRDNNGDFTANNITTIQDLTVQRNLRVQDGAVGGFVQLSVPIALGTSYTLELPRLSGAYGFAGQTLSIDTVVGNTFTTKWIDTLPATLVSGSIFVGNASGTAQARAMSGDATISNTGVLSLSSVGAGVTSGSQYTKVTVDGKGRVTSGTLINFSDVSTALGYSPVASVSTTAPITLTGTASAPVIGLATSGVTSGTYPKVTVDVFGRVTSGSQLNFADVTTGLGYTPFNQATALAGDVTGTVSATVVSFVGGKTSAQVSQSVSDTLAATNLNVSNTIVKRDANGDFTARNITTVNNMTVQGNLVVQDGTVGGSLGLRVPVGFTSYNLTFPTSAGTTGQVLATSGSGILSWVGALTDSLASGSIYIGNASGTAQARAISGDATISNTGVLSLSSIGAGVTSGSQYTKVTVDGKGRVTSGAQLNASDVTTALTYTPVQSVSVTARLALGGTAQNPVIDLGTSGVSASTYPKVTVDVYGRVTSGANLLASDIPNLDASKITTGIFPISQGGTGAASFTANSIIVVSGTTLAGITCATNEILYWNGTRWICGTVSASLGYTPVASVTATAPIIVTGTTSAPNISLAASGVTSGTYPKVTVDTFGRVTSGTTLNFADVTTGLGYTPAALPTASAPIVITGTASSSVISLAASGVTSGTYPKVTVDVYGRVTSGSNLTSADITTGLGYTPFNPATALAGDVTGTVSATVVSFVGGKTSAQVSQSVSDTLAATSLNVSNTIVKRDATGSFVAYNITTVNDMTVQGDLAVQDGTSGGVLGLRVPVGFSSYNLTFPVDDGNANQVLATNGSGLLSWVGTLSDTLASGSIYIGNASGTAQARAISGDATISNTGVLALSSVGAGVTSGSQYTKVTVDGKGRVTSGAQLNATDITTALTYTPVQSVSVTARLSQTGTAQNPVIDLATTGVSASTYPKVTVDVYGRVTSGSNLTLADVTTGLGYTPLNRAGDTMSGNLIMGGNAIVSAGSITIAANNYLGLGQYAADPGLGTLQKGYTWFNTTTNQVKYYDGTSAQVVAAAAAAISTLNGLTNASQSFATGTAGTSFGISSAGSVHTFNIPLANTATVTAGLLSNADYTSFNNKVTSVSGVAGQIAITGTTSSPVVGLATTGVTATTYPKVTVDVYGRVTSGTNLVAADIPNLDAAKITTGIFPISMGGTGASSFTANSIIVASGTTLAGITCATSEILYWNGTRWTCGTVAASLGYTPVASVTATAPLLVTGTTSAPNISLAASGVSAGTYPKVTVDTFGRVTSSTTLNFADVTTGLGYTPGGTPTGSSPIVVTGPASAPVISLAGVGAGVTSGTQYTKVTVDGFGRVTSGTSLSSTDVTNALTYIPFNPATALTGDVTGLVSATVVSFVGGKTSAQVSQSVSDTLAATSLNVSNTIVKRDGSGNFTAGQGTFNTSVRFTDGTAGGIVTLAAPTTFTSYSLTFPGDDGNSGQALITNGTGTLSWLDILSGSLASGTIYVGNASGTAQARVIAGDASINNTGVLTLSSIGAGVTSGTQYTKVTVDGKGRVTSGTSLIASDIPNLDAAKITSGIFPLAQGGTGVSSFTANSLIVASGTTLAGITCANNEIVYWNGTRWTCGTVAASLGYTPVASVTATAPLTITGTASAPNISLSGVGAGVTSGTQYTKVTVDGFGRVTSGAQLSSTDVTNALTYTPVQSVSVTARLSLGGTAQNPVIDLGNSGVSAATYPKVTVDIYGRVTSGSTLNFADVTTGLGYTPVGSVSSTSPITITGSTSAPVIGLATSGVTSGTYPKVSVDTFGRVTSGTNLVAADIPNLDAAKITTGVFPISQGGTGAVSFTANSIIVASGTALAGITCANSEILYWNGTRWVCGTVAASLGYTPLASITATSPLLITGTASAPNISLAYTPVASVSGIAGQIAITGTTSSPVVGLATTGVTSGTYPKVSVDVYGRVTSGSNLTSADITTGLGFTPYNSAAGLQGDVTGTVSATVVSFVGGKTSAQVSQSVSDTINATDANTVSTIVKRDGSGNFIAGQGTFNTSVRVRDGSAGGIVTLAAPSTFTSYSLTFPVDDGNSGQVLSTNGTGTLSWLDVLNTNLASGSILIGNASGTAQARIIAGDATINNTGVLTLSTVGSGITSGSQYTKVTVDAKGRVVSGSQLNASDVTTALTYTPLNRAGDTMSGALTMAGNAIVSAGSITIAANNYLGLGQYAADPGMGTLQKGYTWFNTSSNQIKYYDGTAIQILAATGVGMTSLNGVTSQTQTFAVATAGTSFGISSSNATGTHTFSIPLAATTTVTAGLLSNADYVSFNNKVTSVSGVAGQIAITGTISSPVVGLATTGVTATTYPKVTVDVYGRVTSGTNLVAADIPNLDATKITTGVFPISMGGTGATSFTANSIIVASGTTLAGITCATNEILYWNGTRWICGTVAASLGYTPVASVTGTAPIVITGTASAPNITLANSGVTAATYPKVTVDVFGRVTSGSNLTFTDVTTGLGYSPAGVPTGTAPIVVTGTTSAPVISLASVGAGVTSGTQYTKVTVDGFGRVTSGTSLSSTDVTNALTYIPFNPATALTGDVTGLVSATVVSFVGGKTSAQVSQSVSDTINATSANTVSTIVKRDGSGNFIAGQGTFNTSVRVQDGTAGGIVTLAAPTTFTSYSLTFPVDDGNSGQVLSTNGTGTLSWLDILSGSLASGTIYVGNASGTAQARTIAGDATISNTGVLTLSSVGAGVTSGTQYTKVTVDGKGRVTSGTSLIASDIPNLDAAKITTGIFPISMGGTGASSFTANSLIVASGTTLAGITCANNEIVYWNGTRWTCGTVAASLGYTPVASVTATAPITVTGTASAPVISLANVGAGVTSGTQYTKVTVDGFGRVTSGTSITATDITNALTYTPFNPATALLGDVTGTVSATVVSFVGGKTSAQVSQSVSDTINATDANNNSTIVKRDASGNFISGQATFTTSVRVRDGAAGGIIGISAPAAFTSYNLTLPTTSGTAGQVLSTNGTGVLSWLDILSGSLASGTIYVGNASGTAQARTIAGDATISNTGVLTLSSIGGGVTSGTQYTKVTVDGKGRVTSGANLIAADIPNLDAAKITTGIFPIAQGGTGVSSFTANSLIVASGTTLAGITCANNEIVYWNGTRWTCGTVSTSLGYTPVASVTATAPLQITGTASAPNISLANSGVTSATYGSSTAVPTFSVDAFGRITSASSTTYTDATTGVKGIVQIGSNITVSTGIISITSSNVTTALGAQASGTFYAGPLSGAAALPSFRSIASSDLPITGSTGLFVNGGNSFGTSASVGTNDSNSLIFETNNTARVTLDVSGGVQITGQAWSAVQTSTAATPVTFDANSGNTMRWNTAGGTGAITANIRNMKPGAAYSLVIAAGTGQATINCFSDNGVTTLPSSFIPLNGARSTGTLNKSVYTLISDGENCMITWITGF